MNSEPIILTLSDKWQEIPGGALMLSDDTEAADILLKKGYLGGLHAKNPNQNLSCATWASEDAFFIAVHQCGHVLPADNGYVIYLFPKEKYTVEQVVKYVGMIFCRPEMGNITSKLVHSLLPQEN